MLPAVRGILPRPLIRLLIKRKGGVFPVLLRKRAVRQHAERSEQNARAPQQTARSIP